MLLVPHEEYLEGFSGKENKPLRVFIDFSKSLGKNFKKIDPVF